MQVAIITEGLQGTGYGHLTRCLSIYQAFEEKNIIPLYIANCDEKGKEFLPNVNLLQLDWTNEIKTLLDKIENFDIAIIDSYLAPLEIYEMIKNSVKKTVYIDDYLRLEYPLGVIVNGTIGAENLPYKMDEQHQYLLGLEYMPLRKEFWDVKKLKKDKSKVTDILITFGGQDIRQLTNPILEFLYKKHPNIIFHVVLASNVVEKYFSDNIKYYKSLNAEEILNLMLKCDIAITAAGQTTYELARVGIRTIAIGVVDNQKYNLLGWKKDGFIEDIIIYNDSGLLEHIDDFIKNNIGIHNNVFYNGQGARNIIENLERNLE